MKTLKRFKSDLKVAQQALDVATSPRQSLPGGSHEWLGESMQWLVRRFGRKVLRRPVVTPAEFVPAGYAGTSADAQTLFAAVCDRMDLDPAELDLRIEELPSLRASTGLWRDGLWERVDGRTVIRVSPAVQRDPVLLVSVFAHELGHELLAGSDRSSAAGRSDHEPMTDLLTVFYGFGIFTANSSYERVRDPRTGGWQMVRRGYLGEDALGDALGLYCWMRGERSPIHSWMPGERSPRWVRQLDRRVQRRAANHYLRLKHSRYEA